uniref:Uncharacterized protein n=1 Tax=Ciona intestinalis TaxID=7719 RepID=H2XS75_CIOIN
MMWRIASPESVPTPSATKNCVIILNTGELRVGNVRMPTNANMLMTTTAAVP